MKTKTFVVIKINRVWIDARCDNFNCKIKIDDLSKDLTIGSHELLVEDVSVRSKYGTDQRYKVLSDGKDETKIFFAHSMYNSTLVDECRRLGGVYDHEGKTWVFSSLVEKEVDALEEEYNSSLIGIEIFMPEGDSVLTGSISFCGYPIASASGRDSGAKTSAGISVISGGFDSSGSMKNWTTVANAKTRIRIKIPKNVYEKRDDYTDNGVYKTHSDDQWIVKII